MYIVEHYFSLPTGRVYYFITEYVIFLPTAVQTKRDKIHFIGSGMYLYI